MQSSGLDIRWVGRRPQPIGSGSATWEVVQVPGLFVMRLPGKSYWQMHAVVQQRSLAYRIWTNMANQRFRTRREALSALEAVHSLMVSTQGM